MPRPFLIFSFLILFFLALGTAIAPTYADETDALKKTLSERIEANRKALDIFENKQREARQVLRELGRREETLRAQIIDDRARRARWLTRMAQVNRTPKNPVVAYEMATQTNQRTYLIDQVDAGLKTRLEACRHDLKELFTLQQRQKDALAQAEASLEAARTSAKDLEKMGKQLADIGDLSNKERKQLAQRIGAGDTSPRVAETLEQSKTYDFLPAIGRVVVGYGKSEENPVGAHGLTIAAEPGGEVHALKSGRVIYSGPFKGYGTLVIVEHAGKQHSLYSGFEKTRHQVGENVAAGDILGTLPLQSAPELYLEVREDGHAVDPTRWLEGAQKKQIEAANIKPAATRQG